jgi:hypothetical protein
MRLVLLLEELFLQGLVAQVCFQRSKSYHSVPDLCSGLGYHYSKHLQVISRLVFYSPRMLHQQKTALNQAQMAF